MQRPSSSIFMMGCAEGWGNPGLIIAGDANFERRTPRLEPGPQSRRLRRLRTPCPIRSALKSSSASRTLADRPIRRHGWSISTRPAGLHGRYPQTVGREIRLHFQPGPARPGRGRSGQAASQATCSASSTTLVAVDAYDQAHPQAKFTGGLLALSQTQSITSPKGKRSARLKATGVNRSSR